MAASGGGRAAAKTLAILFAINAMNFFDRQILGAVGEPVRREWQLSDGALGLLGTAFTLLYAFVGVPLGRLADRKPRTLILAAGVFAWSALTAVSGMARSFWQLFVVRLGVGVGEATCAPAATSLIGDLFPPARRARALGVFMMGLPVGIALSYLVSGYVARAWGWRAAFYVAGIPGLLCAAAMLLVPEPARGRTETHDVGSRQRPGSPYLLVLGTPTMWWIILSGALHNFTMYALGAWLAPYLMRYHGTDIAHAGLVLTGAYGLAGTPGLLLGGVAADAMLKRRRDGRLLLGAVCLAASAPLLWATMQVAPGRLWPFALLLGAAVALMYVYYAVVYSSIQDVIEPSLRGTAMALYFFAMYVMGASFGTWATGLASDHFTQRAAAAAGIVAGTGRALEPFRATGLQSALELLPALGVLLAVVVWAASRTVTRDMDRLQEWMRAGGRVNARYVETTVRGRYLVEPGPADARTLLVGFHGYGETAETHLERLRRFPGASRAVLVSVQSLHLFYTKAGEVVGSWMTKLGREHAIRDNVAYVGAVVSDVERSFPAADRLLYVGFSQGASMAYRAAAHAGHGGAGVFVLGGDMPPDVADDPAAPLPPVLAARGVRDDWFTEAKLQRDVERLRARGVSVRSVVFEGGHEWPDPLFDAASDFVRSLEAGP